MYYAIIARLSNVREHPSADRLKLATVLGSQVVVGLDANEGELGIYFPTDGKLSLEYCTQNDLYPRYEIDETSGTKKKVGGGMFDPKNSRVRAQNLRSVKSDGYFADLKSVEYTGVNLADLFEGYQFSELKDHPICEKYYTPKTLNAMKGGTPATKKKNIMFVEHVDTEQFAYKADRVIVPGSIVTITEKIHGTSHRVGNVIDETVTKKWYHKLFKREGKTKREWKTFHGTRRVVIGDAEKDTNGGWHGSHAFRYKATESLEGNLRKGEVLYGEIVGYTDDTGLIMGSTSTKDLRKDPEFKALFDTVPVSMEYTYNCLPGENEFYVYRITQVDEDGHATELSWPQVKARCGELGVKYVPDVYDEPDQQAWVVQDGDLKMVEMIVLNTQGGVSSLDPTTLREGVVVRVDTPDGQTHFLKQKQYFFKVLEGIAKMDTLYVDTEEVS